MEVESKTENVLFFDILSTREFPKAQKFTEAKGTELRAARDGHLKKMLGFMKQVNNI